MIKIYKKNFNFSLIYICLILLTIVLLNVVEENYFNVATVGSIMAIAVVLVNVCYEKKVIIPKNIILLCFILFQFGIVFFTVFDKGYTNWYLNQFTKNELSFAIKYSIVCIEFFAWGLLFSEGKKNLKASKIKRLSDENKVSIYKISCVLFNFCALIACPIQIYIIILANKYGYNYTKTISFGMLDGVVRFVQTMIVPAILLCIVFVQNNKKRRLFTYCALIYAILLIATRARTTALALILVLLIMKSENNNENDINNKKNIGKSIFLVLGAIIIIYVAVIMAQYRYSGTVNSLKVTDIVYSIVEEMGFNFSSINFIRIFVPHEKPFQYGLSYLKSIICLFPKTLDPFGFISRIYYTLPEIELSNWLSNKFGAVYDFGVGFSVIAESYYNFGKFGFISVYIQGIIIGKVLSEYKSKSSLFSTYVRYVMLFSLITYPRRSFSTLLKGIEYYIFLVIIIIILFTKKDKVKNNK